MPDITMCTGDKCPKKESCYRFTAKADARQSFFAAPPVNGKGECRHYWEVTIVGTKQQDL